MTIKPKTRLLGSSPNLASAEKMIADFYCGTPIKIVESNVIRISDGKTLEGVRVVNKNGRYRFERVLS